MITNRMESKQQNNNNEAAKTEQITPKIESVKQIPEITQKTRGFFDMIKSAYNSPDMDGENPLKPESKEQANENIDSAANRFEQLLSRDDQGEIEPSPTAYVEGMAFLADHYGRSLENQINGYESYPEDMQEEIKKKDQEAEALFIKAGQKIFPEIVKPQNAEDAISQLQNLSGKEYEHPLLNPDLQFLVSVAGDKRRLIKELDRVALFNGYSVANTMDSAMRVNGGNLSESHRQEMIEQQRAIYQLRLLRDAVAGEVYGRQDLSPQDQAKIDSLRSQVGLTEAGNPAENNQENTATEECLIDLHELERKETEEAITGTVKAEKMKKSNFSELYQIKNTDGSFEVVLPGLTMEGNGLIAGTIKERFNTEAEAAQAVEKAQEHRKTAFELASLRKTFSGFYKIDNSADGKFKVTLPGLVQEKTGRYFGTTSREFVSWDEAKNYYLQDRENNERLTREPLLEIKTGENEKMAFSDLEAFNPRLAPIEQAREIPASINSYFIENGRLDGSDKSALTYQETIKKPGWENEIYSFVSGYLKNQGVELAGSLNIENLDGLTPKQAVELSTQVVVDLTKYKNSDINSKQGETQADQDTVLQLLQEGLANRQNQQWEGNGVCRNFASAVKAVFESLKAKQTKFNLLNDTYCLFEGATSGFEFKRQDTDSDTLSMGINPKNGHAWNTFVTISREGSANATIIDATWAKRDLETRQVTGLDYTLERMEPLVYKSAEKIAKAPDSQEQLRHLLSYYAFRIDQLNLPTTEDEKSLALSDADKKRYHDFALKHYKKDQLSGWSDGELWRLGQSLEGVLNETKKKDAEQYLIDRAVDIAFSAAMKGTTVELPGNISSNIGQKYLENNGKLQKDNLEKLYWISNKNQGLDLPGILKKYFADKELPATADKRNFGEQISFRDNNLQRLVFDALRSRPDFEDILSNNINLRSRFEQLNQSA